MTQTKGWNALQQRLYRQARHQVISQMTPPSHFDGDGNTVGDQRPGDFKRYWDSLTDEQRAFEILANTEAAQFIAFWNKIQSTIPKPHVAP